MGGGGKSVRSGAFSPAAEPGRGGERRGLLRSGLLGFRRRSLGLDLGVSVSHGERVVRGERRRREERRGNQEAEASGVKMRRDDDGCFVPLRRSPLKNGETQETCGLGEK